jgi:hypothetical protein
VFHEPFRNQTVRLEGSGPIFLWTKNALERNGYSIDSSATKEIQILEKSWRCGGKEFFNLKDLLTDLNG